MMLGVAGNDQKNDIMLMLILKNMKVHVLHYFVEIIQAATDSTTKD